MTRKEYIGTITINGIKVDIGLDDYGQSYFFEYDKDNEHYIKGCGTYNNDFIETICYELDEKGAFISIFDEEAWEDKIEFIEGVYHSRMEKNPDDEKLKEHYEYRLYHMRNDDYNLYDFKEMYKLIGIQR